MFKHNKLVSIFLIMTILGCDSYKSITSKYNILYNGELFFDEGLAQLRDAYTDNYWDVIPVLVENNLIDFRADFPSKNFLKSEEKAIKVVQKMGNAKNIDSDYINKAYLLLGKSRFFDKRLISSLQAFNYILKQEKKTNIWLEAYFWRTLIYINLEQFDLASSSINKILNSNEISNKSKLKSFEVLSELYFQKKDYKSLISSLKKALVLSNDKNQIQRFNFILAQSYAKLNIPDSSAIYFQKSTDVKTSKFREIYLDAKLKLTLIKNVDFNEDFFEKSLKRATNISAKSKINYYYGVDYLNKGNSEYAKNKFIEALKNNLSDQILEVKIYEKLFDISLENKMYSVASNYLDTLLNKIDPLSKKFFLFQSKKEKINSISKLEKQNILIDSLMYLSTIDVEQVNKLFNSNPNDVVKKRGKIKTDKTNTSKGFFYFNNTTAISIGQKEFTEVWGNRQRVDNWRNLNGIKLNIKVIQKNKTFAIQDSVNKFNLKSIPYLKEQQDSLVKIKNQNYFKKGVYLYEYFNDLENSEKDFLKIDSALVSSGQFLQSRYYLYRIYNSQTLKSIKKASEIKKIIINDFPESIYAQKIINNNVNQQNDLDYLKFYENIQNKIKKSMIGEALFSIDSVLNISQSRQDTYKLLLLKYDIEAKSIGVKNYVNSLKELRNRYPENSNDIKNKIKTLEKFLSRKSTLIDIDSFVLFFENPIEYEQEKLINFDYTIEYYDYKTKLITFYGFNSENEAKIAYRTIIEKNPTLSSNKYFVISTSQYVDMLVFKTLNELK